LKYQLADSVSILQKPEGNYLVASRPLRMVRLNNGLLTLAQQMQSGWLTPMTDSERSVLETLARRGLLQRKREPLRMIETLPIVSVVIPVKDRADDLRNCMLSLLALDYPKDKLEIVVVDDGSSDETPEVARELGGHVISSGKVGGGPALARNRGASVARGEILAFIDSDCTASPNWLMELLPVFSEDKVAAVGGWVDGMHDASSLDRYEAVMSSLNLGRREMSGGTGGDTFYLPSCNLLIRNDTFTAAGGFRDSMQVGEDVDLTWRLRDAGWQIVYLPEGSVCHAHRSLLWPFMKRRFEYGTSEGLLQRLHPVRGKKMLIPPMLAAILSFLSAALLFWSWLPLPLAAVLFLFDSISCRLKLHKQGLKLPGLG
jgi:mycofactocin system glycosyltransferase